MGDIREDIIEVKNVLYNVAGITLRGEAVESFDRIEDELARLRARVADLEHLIEEQNSAIALRDERLAELEGQEPAGYAAQCEDGSLCYKYFTEHKEGIQHAIKSDGWEGMEPVPVYTTPPPAPSVPDDETVNRLRSEGRE